MALREFSLFTGCGGGLLASKMLGWDTVAGCESDEFARARLIQRQIEGHLDIFPIWDDIRTLEGRPWRGHVDVVSGGFPCQDISSAGKRRGLAGPKSGLWSEMRRVIDEVQPEFVFVENSSELVRSGLDRVLRNLDGLGFDAEWDVLGVSDLGGPHRRNRLWLVGRNAANADNKGERTRSIHAEMAGASQTRRACGASWWGDGHPTPRVDDGATDRSHRNRLTGNAQVPALAATAFRILRARLEDHD